MSLIAQLHTSPSSFQDLAREWHGLLPNAITNHVFQTPEFLQTWWETLGEGELCIITARTQAGELVAIAPFFLHEANGKQQLSFVGCVDVADYLDCVVHRDHEAAAYDLIAQEILKLKWDSLYLCSFPDASPTPKHLSELLKGRGELQKTQQDVSPLIHLPASWDEYLESLDRKQRHEIRRKWRKLQRETQFEFKIITQPEEVPAATLQFVELHKASSPGKKRFWDEHHVAFFTNFLTAAAQAGWLKLYFLIVDGKQASTMLVFEYAHRAYLYNSGYDPNYYREMSTGSTLTAYTIRDAIEQGSEIYDFLRGDEQYKFRFGAQPEPVWDLHTEQ